MSRRNKAPDALALLKDEHETIRGLVRDFERIKGRDDEDARKAELVDQICYELTLHILLEESTFYPALRAAIDDDELLDEAEVEHAGARDLIGELEVMFPGDDHFDATVTVLGEEIERHFEKEETELFAAARRAGLDLDALGEQMAERKQALEEDLSAPATTLEAMLPPAELRRQPRAPE
jgi:hemerythrin-like domain-containing protein